MDRFFPDLYQKSIYDINYKKLKKQGVKCLLFDLDNTCVPYHESVASDELKKLFDKLKRMSFKVIIFSNSPKRRLKKFSGLGVDYNALSMKPITYSFKRVLGKYNYNKDEVCIIGDQLFTDIYGGNKVGIKTCLVEPLSDIDLAFTKISRFFENRKFKRYEEQGRFKKGKYYD